MTGKSPSLPSSRELNRRSPLPQGFIASTPGFNVSSGLTDGGNFQTTLTRLGTPIQQAFDQRFPRILSDFDSLREAVRPGFSALRDARLAENDNTRSRAIGNLRENLGRRRVLGSSFGQDAQVRAELAVGQERDRIQAETFLQEIDATSNLIQQESTQLFNAINRELAELGIATQFNTSTGQIFSNNQQFLQQQAAQLAVARANTSSSNLSATLETVGTIGGAVAGGFFGGPLGAAGGASAGGSLGRITGGGSARTSPAAVSGGSTRLPASF